jgi:hypothetical protein
MADFLLCSNCFRDQGLRLDAENIGIIEASACPKCGSTAGSKLTSGHVVALARRFFVWGTLHRLDYGGAPIVEFNEYQQTSIETSPWFEPDVRLIEESLGVGFFYYGPRLSILGEVEPLKALQEPMTRAPIIDRIIREYPSFTLTTDQVFYRIRKSPALPAGFGEYDTAPLAYQGANRFD